MDFRKNVSTISVDERTTLVEETSLIKAHLKFMLDTTYTHNSQNRTENLFTLYYENWE